MLDVLIGVGFAAAYATAICLIWRLVKATENRHGPNWD